MLQPAPVSHAAYPSNFYGSSSGPQGDDSRPHTSYAKHALPPGRKLKAARVNSVNRPMPRHVKHKQLRGNSFSAMPGPRSYSLGAHRKQVFAGGGFRINKRLQQQDVDYLIGQQSELTSVQQAEIKEIEVTQDSRVAQGMFSLHVGHSSQGSHYQQFGTQLNSSVNVQNHGVQMDCNTEQGTRQSQEIAVGKSPGNFPGEDEVEIEGKECIVENFAVGSKQYRLQSDQLASYPRKDDYLKSTLKKNERSRDYQKSHDQRLTESLAIKESMGTENEAISRQIVIDDVEMKQSIKTRQTKMQSAHSVRKSDTTEKAQDTSPELVQMSETVQHDVLSSNKNNQSEMMIKQGVEKVIVTKNLQEQEVTVHQTENLQRYDTMKKSQEPSSPGQLGSRLQSEHIMEEPVSAQIIKRKKMSKTQDARQTKNDLSGIMNELQLLQDQLQSDDASMGENYDVRGMVQTSAPTSAHHQKKRSSVVSEQYLQKKKRSRSFTRHQSRQEQKGAVDPDLIKFYEAFTQHKSSHKLPIVKKNSVDIKEDFIKYNVIHGELKQTLNKVRNEKVKELEDKNVQMNQIISDFKQYQLTSQKNLKSETLDEPSSIPQAESPSKEIIVIGEIQSNQKNHRSPNSDVIKVLDSREDSPELQKPPYQDLSMNEINVKENSVLSGQKDSKQQLKTFQETGLSYDGRNNIQFLNSQSQDKTTLKNLKGLSNDTSQLPSPNQEIQIQVRNKTPEPKEQSNSEHDQIRLNDKLMQNQLERQGQKTLRQSPSKKLATGFQNDMIQQMSSVNTTQRVDKYESAATSSFLEPMHMITISPRNAQGMMKKVATSGIILGSWQPGVQEMRQKSLKYDKNSYFRVPEVQKDENTQWNQKQINTDMRNLQARNTYSLQYNMSPQSPPDKNTLEKFEKELIKSAMNKPLLEAKADYSSNLQQRAIENILRQQSSLLAKKPEQIPGLTKEETAKLLDDSNDADPKLLFQNLSITQDDVKYGTMPNYRETISEKGVMNIKSQSCSPHMDARSMSSGRKSGRSTTKLQLAKSKSRSLKRGTDPTTLNHIEIMDQKRKTDPTTLHHIDIVDQKEVQTAMKIESEHRAILNETASSQGKFLNVKPNLKEAISQSLENQEQRYNLLKSDVDHFRFADPKGIFEVPVSQPTTNYYKSALFTRIKTLSGEATQKMKEKVEKRKEEEAHWQNLGNARNTILQLQVYEQPVGNNKIEPKLSEHGSPKKASETVSAINYIHLHASAKASLSSRYAQREVKISEDLAQVVSPLGTNVETVILPNASEKSRDPQNATQLAHASQENTGSGEVIVEGRVIQINSMTVTPDGVVIAPVVNRQKLYKAASMNTSGHPISSQNELRDENDRYKQTSFNQQQNSSNKRVQALRRLADGSIKSLNSMTEDKHTKYQISKNEGPTQESVEQPGMVINAQKRHYQMNVPHALTGRNERIGEEEILKSTLMQAKLGAQSKAARAVESGKLRSNVNYSGRTPLVTTQENQQSDETFLKTRSKNATQYPPTVMESPTRRHQPSASEICSSPTDDNVERNKTAGFLSIDQSKSEIMALQPKMIQSTDARVPQGQLEVHENTMSMDCKTQVNVPITGPGSPRDRKASTTSVVNKQNIQGITSAIIDHNGMKILVADGRMQKLVQSMIKRPVKKVPFSGARRGYPVIDKNANSLEAREKQKKMHQKFSGMVGQSDELTKHFGDICNQIPNDDDKMVVSIKQRLKQTARAQSSMPGYLRGPNSRSQIGNYATGGIGEREALHRQQLEQLPIMKTKSNAIIDVISEIPDAQNNNRLRNSASMNINMKMRPASSKKESTNASTAILNQRFGANTVATSLASAAMNAPIHTRIGRGTNLQRARTGDIRTAAQSSQVKYTQGPSSQFKTEEKLLDMNQRNRFAGPSMNLQDEIDVTGKNSVDNIKTPPEILVGQNVNSNYHHPLTQKAANTITQDNFVRPKSNLFNSQGQQKLRGLSGRVSMKGAGQNLYNQLNINNQGFAGYHQSIPKALQSEGKNGGMTADSTSQGRMTSANRTATTSYNPRNNRMHNKTAHGARQKNQDIRIQKARVSTANLRDSKKYQDSEF